MDSASPAEVVHESILQNYSDQFSHLHTNRNRTRWTARTTFRAPHKPLLLLSVIDSAAEGLLNTNCVQPSEDLIENFGLYWSKVLPFARRGNAALPFFHLRSEGFWDLIPRPGQEHLLPALRQIDTMGDLRNRVLGAMLPEDLYALLQDSSSRTELQQVLVDTYFEPDLRHRLHEQSQVNEQAFKYSNLLLDGQFERIPEFTLPGGEREARSEGFRRAVTVAYERRCTMCGIRVITAAGHTAVDAAHIRPWARTRDDRVTNGLALCKLCHWCFDEGLVTVSDGYRVLTARQLMGQENKPGHIHSLDRREILLPNSKALWPDIESLSWHQREVFRMR